jgi:predicted RNA-binding protein with RPS1 domain
MSLKKVEWPEPGDLVLTSVQRITDYGAYVTLDEYGKEGLLHVSEVSTAFYGPGKATEEFGRIQTEGIAVCVLPNRYEE